MASFILLFAARYAELRAQLLPQLDRDADHCRVTVEMLDARLTAALTASTFTPLAVQRWQTTGRGHPCHLHHQRSHTAACMPALDGSSGRAAAELQRHNALARLHWDLTCAAGERARRTGGHSSTERDFRATLIQAAWRGRAGRAAAAQERQRRQGAARQHDAALRIQAAVRGWRARQALRAARLAVQKRVTWTDDDEESDEVFPRDVDLLIDFRFDLPSAQLHGGSQPTGSAEALPELDMLPAGFQPSWDASILQLPEDVAGAWLDSLTRAGAFVGHELPSTGLQGWHHPATLSEDFQPQLGGEGDSSIVRNDALTTPVQYAKDDIQASTVSGTASQEDKAVSEATCSQSAAAESPAAASSSNNSQQERRGSQRQVGMPLHASAEKAPRCTLMKPCFCRRRSRG
jgi:hypothetical protein